MNYSNHLLRILSCLLLLTSFVVDQKIEAATILKIEQQPTLIEILEHGETYTIEITSVGCFNGTRQTLTIQREEEIYTASLQGTSKLLSAADLETLRTFELELRGLKMGGCTTADTYILRYGSETFQTSDGSCSWHGYRKLLQLFK